MTLNDVLTGVLMLGITGFLITGIIDMAVRYHKEQKVEKKCQKKQR